MNRTAPKSWGSASTCTTPASGVNPGSRSDAPDQALLAAALMRYPVIRAIVSKPSLAFPVAGTIWNFNPGLGTDGIIGVKSGFTSEASGCLATAAYRAVDGRHVLVVAVSLGQPAGLYEAAQVDEGLLDAAGRSLVEFTVPLPASGIGDLVLGGTSAPLGLVGAMPRLVGWPGLQLSERLQPLGPTGPPHVATVANLVISSPVGVLASVPLTTTRPFSATTTSSTTTSTVPAAHGADDDPAVLHGEALCRDRRAPRPRKHRHLEPGRHLLHHHTSGGLTRAARAKPASTSNLGPGFDVLGLALKLYLEVEITPAPRLPGPHRGRGRRISPRTRATSRRASRARWPGTTVVSRSGSPRRSPSDADSAPRRHSPSPPPQRPAPPIHSRSPRPPTATPRTRVLLAPRWARRGDPRRGGYRWRDVSCSTPRCASWCSSPKRHLETKAARAMLPASLPFSDAVFNLGRSAWPLAPALAAAEALEEAAGEDRLHQRQRAALFPEAPELLAALPAGGARARTCVRGRAEPARDLHESAGGGALPGGGGACARDTGGSRRGGRTALLILEEDCGFPD